MRRRMPVLVLSALALVGCGGGSNASINDYRDGGGKLGGGTVETIRPADRTTTITVKGTTATDAVIDTSTFRGEVVDRARGEAAGHEAVLVSHQSPVWIARLALEHRRLWHDPRKRQCSLASLTSLTYEGDRLLAITFSEPAAALLPGASRVAGA